MIDPTGRASDEAARDDARRAANDGWSAFSLVLSGLLVWGGIGWLVSAWVDSPLPMAAGVLLGTAGGVALVWLRYGRA